MRNKRELSHTRNDSPNASAIPSSEMVDNMERYKPLYEACVKGDWDSVKHLVEDNPDPNLWTTGIDTYGNPALCVAALSGQTNLIRNLVELIPEEALLATGYRCYTALHYIAKNRDVEAAKILVTKSPLLTQIPNNENETPLLHAALFGCKEMVRFLVTVTEHKASDRWPSPFRGRQGAALLINVINMDLYDVALHLVEKYDGIATTTDLEGMPAIRALARKCWPDSAMSRGHWSGNHCLTNSIVPISRANDIMYKQYLELTECICNRISLDRTTMKDFLKGVLLEASNQGCVDFVKLIINIDSVKHFVKDNPEGICTYWNPALCVAALSGQTNVIRNLVELMPEEALLATDYCGYTALHHTAKNGDVEAAKMLVNKNPLLTQIPNIDESMTPLLGAARFGCKEMVRYLVTVTKDEASDRWPSPFRGEQGAALLVYVINVDLYDVALHLVQKYDGIAIAKYYEGHFPDGKKMSAIRALARKCWPDSAMSRGFTMSRANDIMYKQYLELTECICNRIRLLDRTTMNDLLEGVLLEASKQGCVDFLKLIINIDSRQIMSTEGDGIAVLHSAVRHRQKEVFHYLKHLKFKNELSTQKIYDSGDTILHLAAKISPSRVLNQIPGAALQLQHDIQWYKEVAAMVPFYENIRNPRDWTPKDLFYEEHQALIREGEKWMQNIASSSMVVATLIATVVFAAAFTVPGGTRSDMGLPFFLNKRSYLVFAVSNALALSFSLTSVLIFLSILTSTYGIEDFLVSLPRRLIIGEAMLFFAIATMTTAFGATYFIMLGHKLAWLSILIASFISLSVILFVILQARLFAEIFKSTYMSSL